MAQAVDSLPCLALLSRVVWPADGGITGDYPPTGGDPGGDSMDGALCDCVGMEGLDDVLCYAWRVGPRWMHHASARTLTLTLAF